MQIVPETKVFVVGCGGMLGDAVYRHFSTRCRVAAFDIDVNEPWLEYGDVRDYAATSLAIRMFAPDLIINLAALTDLEFCEREPENAWLTNALGAENVGLIASRLDVPYVYISTAGIFDGNQPSYNDFDRPNPLGVYARSKCHGEEWTLRSVKKHFVFRAGWMMGGGPNKDKKFVNKIWKQISSGATTIFAVNDKRGTPTYTADFARGIERVVESGLYGLYNQVCSGEASRYDVAKAFVSELGLERKVRVEAVSSSRFASEYSAPRPASEQLVNTKLEARKLNVMRDWRTCLSEYAREFTE